MRTIARVCVGLLPILVIAAVTARPADAGKDAFAFNRLLGRGINLGNALEAPREGAWGLTLKAEDFRAIKKAGFDSVRIPIRWSAHAGQKAPYTVDPAFFKRVDWAIDQALDNKLTVVINDHHNEEVFRDPTKYGPRLEALWKQIAHRYHDRSDRLYFELLNEPHGALTDERWQQLFSRLLAAVRATNARRIVIIGPGQWNGIGSLGRLRLPENDRGLIVTFHDYNPFHFTHQGAPWAQGSRKWLGTTWIGTPQEQAAMHKDFERVAAWAKKHDRPIYLGEFGAYSAAPMASRVNWTRAMVSEARRHGFSWAYWEFGSGFGAYDPGAGAWRRPLLEALVGKGAAR
jgi:endoglucanase